MICYLNKNTINVIINYLANRMMLMITHLDITTESLPSSHWKPTHCQMHSISCEFQEYIDLDWSLQVKLNTTDKVTVSCVDLLLQGVMFNWNLSLLFNMPSNSVNISIWTIAIEAAPWDSQRNQLMSIDFMHAKHFQWTKANNCLEFIWMTILSTQ